MIAECRKDTKYVVCFVGGAVVRLINVIFSTFLLLWVTSFVDQGLYDEEYSKTLYQKLMITTGVGSLLFMPLIGQIGDKVPSKVIIPVAFTFRSIMALLFMRIHDPETTFARVIILLMCIFTVVEAISVEVLLMRDMPNKIRGTMMGLF